MGLCRPTAGRIAADAVDDAELVLSSVHDRVAAAFQEFFNFQLTAAQSIAPGRPTAFGGAEGIRPDLVQVERAVRLDGADDFVAALPDGYATPVGHELHGGQGLSGGQRPRLAVSRTWTSRRRPSTRAPRRRSTLISTNCWRAAPACSSATATAPPACATASLCSRRGGLSRTAATATSRPRAGGRPAVGAAEPAVPVGRSYRCRLPHAPRFRPPLALRRLGLRHRPAGLPSRLAPVATRWHRL